MNNLTDREISERMLATMEKQEAHQKYLCTIATVYLIATFIAVAAAFLILS